MANAIVAAWLRHAVVDIDLTTRSSESDGTRAFESVYHVRAGSAIQTWLRFAFVDVDFALRSRETCHKIKQNSIIKNRFNCLWSSRASHLACIRIEMCPGRPDSFRHFDTDDFRIR